MLRRVLRTPLLVVTAIALMLAAPGTSTAAETIAPGYTASTLTYPGGAPITCGITWSGGSDAAGNFYVACVGYVLIFTADGAYSGFAKLPAGYVVKRDVAPSADGNQLYIVTSDASNGHIYDRPDPLTVPKAGHVIRLVRGSTGWAHDTTFDIAPTPLIAGDPTRWAPRNLSIADDGHIFLTINAYVREYDTAGRLIATFGGSDAGIDIAQGIAVTRDGDHVWVVEQGRWTIQRWDRTGPTSWRRGALIGQARLDSDCAAIWDARFAAPYDVQVDGGGGLYVLDTSCRRVIKFNALTYTWSSNVWRNYVNTGLLYHGMAVNYRGDVLIPEMLRIFRAGSGAAIASRVCAPDYDAPVITRLAAPTVTYERTVQLSVSARDGCSRWASMRITGEIDGGGSWRTASTSPTVVLDGSSGAHLITVTVRDSWGRTSARTISVTRDTTLPTPRRTVRMFGRTRYCSSDPMSGLTSGWRLADRCATFRGLVLEVRRRGATRKYRVLLPTSTAQSMFRSARGPVAIWVVGTSRTSGARYVRVGRSLVFTSALVVDRSGRSLSAAPLRRISQR